MLDRQWRQTQTRTPWIKRLKLPNDWGEWKSLLNTCHRQMVDNRNYDERWYTWHVSHLCKTCKNYEWGEWKNIIGECHTQIRFVPKKRCFHDHLLHSCSSVSLCFIVCPFVFGPFCLFYLTMSVSTFLILSSCMFGHIYCLIN